VELGLTFSLCSIRFISDLCTSSSLLSRSFPFPLPCSFLARNSFKILLCSRCMDQRLYQICGGSLLSRKSTSRIKYHVHPLASSSSPSQPKKGISDRQYHPIRMLSGIATLLCWMDGLPDCTAYYRGMAGLSGFICESDLCSTSTIVSRTSPPSSKPRMVSYPVVTTKVLPNRSLISRQHTAYT